MRCDEIRSKELKIHMNDHILPSKGLPSVCCSSCSIMSVACGICIACVLMWAGAKEVHTCTCVYMYKYEGSTFHIAEICAHTRIEVCHFFEKNMVKMRLLRRSDIRILYFPYLDIIRSLK